MLSHRVAGVGCKKTRLDHSFLWLVTGDKGQLIQQKCASFPPHALLDLANLPTLVNAQSSFKVNLMVLGAFNLSSIYPGLGVWVNQPFLGHPLEKIMDERTTEKMCWTGWLVPSIVSKLYSAFALIFWTRRANSEKYSVLIGIIRSGLYGIGDFEGANFDTPSIILRMVQSLQLDKDDRNAKPSDQRLKSSSRFL